MKNMVGNKSNYKTLITAVLFWCTCGSVLLYHLSNNDYAATYQSNDEMIDHKYDSRMHTLNLLINKQKQLEAYMVGDPPSLQDINDCKTNTITSTGAFCVTKDHLIIGGNQEFSKNLAKMLCQMFQNKSVLDLGAGLGHYTRYLRDNNCVTFILAYDGGIGVYEATQGLVQRKDLTKAHDLGQFDYVLSLEVAEHIPKVYENVFINNLHKHNKQGLILSWAVIGQGGHHHVNCQSAEYVIEKIENLGYHYDENTALQMRGNVTDCCQWFQKTIYVFRK